MTSRVLRQVVLPQRCYLWMVDGWVVTDVKVGWWVGLGGLVAWDTYLDDLWKLGQWLTHDRIPWCCDGIAGLLAVERRGCLNR